MTLDELSKEDRIQQAINLIQESKLSNYKIAQDTKISQATIGNYKNCKTRPTEANAEIIIKYFSNPINKDEIIDEVKQLDQAIVMQVPLVNQYAYAGYTSGFQDETYIAQLPVIPFFVDHEAKGNYMAFEVRGDSMNDGSADSYIEGDRLLGREISPNLWCQTKLHLRKWDFIIVHEDGILIKRIIDHDVANHTITIHSLNPLYEDRVIDLCGVKQIFNVIELQRPKRR